MNPARLAEMTVLEAALRYAQRGWYLFPVRGATAGKDDPDAWKRPALDLCPNWSTDSTRDPEMLTAWFAGTTGLGLGLDLRKSGIVVVDGDHLDLLDLPSHLLTGWPYRGNPERRSWLYSLNGHPIPQAKHPWGEVKSGGDGTNNGGYVVLPPSPHPVGGQYVWSRTVDPFTDELVVIPADLEALIRPVERGPVTSAETFDGEVDDDDVAEALRVLGVWADKVAEAEEGGGQFNGRNNALNAAAMRLGHFVPHYLDADVVTEALLRAARDCGLVRDDGESACRSTIASGMKAGTADPWKVNRGVTVLDFPDALSAEVVEGLWERTETLSKIRQAAHHHQASAWAVLGACLARTSMLTHYSISLPSTPNYGSLNYFVGLVSESGGGKSSAAYIAEDLLPAEPLPCHCRDTGHLGDYVIVPTGSGEGLAKTFFSSVKEPGPDGKMRTTVRQDRRHVMVVVDEIETLLAISSRSTSTIGPVLRSMWSASAPAGFNNASEERRTPLAPRAYRLSLLAGVQPKVVGRLLKDEAEGGTPQRFVWFPADDPSIPDLENGGVLPEWPGPLPPVRQEDKNEPWSVFTVGVAESVAHGIRIRRNRAARGVEKGHRLDRHRDFNRLRTAALLALLHQEREVTEEWWEVAGAIMGLSDVLRSSMLEAISAEAEETAKARGRMDALRAEGEREAVSEAVERVAHVLARLVERHTTGDEKKHDSCPGNCLTRALRSSDRPLKDQALEYAVSTDLIEQVDGGRFVAGKHRVAQ